MKNIIPILFIVVFASSMVFAQGVLPVKGDSFVGGRIGFGSYGAGVGFGGGAEYVLQENFLNLGDIPASLGIGGSFGYSNYRSGFLGYHWKYTNTVFLGSVFYHADVLQNEKIDTYVKFSLGYNAGKVKYDGPSGITDYSSPTHGGVVTGSAIGARYFVSKTLAAVAEVGWGFGILRLGLDFVL